MGAYDHWRWPGLGRVVLGMVPWSELVGSRCERNSRLHIVLNYSKLIKLYCYTEDISFLTLLCCQCVFQG